MTETFFCQRCSNQLKLDDTVSNLNTVQVNLLRQQRGLGHGTKEEEDTHEEDDELDPTNFISSDKLDFYNDLNDDDEPILYKNDISGTEENHVSVSTSLTSNSFVMLSDGESINGHKEDSNEDNDGAISSRLRTLQKVFEVLSTNNEVDHPLCKDCSDLIIQNYKLKFDQGQREKDYYLSFLKKLRDQGEMVKDEELEVDKKLLSAISEFEKLRIEEKEKLQELKVLEETRDKLDNQLLSLQEEYDDLEKNEFNDILDLKNNLSLDLSASTNKLNQLKGQYQDNLNYLDKLREFNIYNNIFHISNDEDNKYGTINGLRLGYKIPWSEINSALGQVVLLMIFLSKRLKLGLDSYKLVPLGSQSQIIKYGNENTEAGVKRHKTILNLYSSDDFSLGKLFNFNKFDVSMIALLDILSHIEEKLLTLDNELELPYKISAKKDAIGGKSIRVTSNSEWTDGCKFLLTNLNWILAYTSVHTTNSNV